MPRKSSDKKPGNSLSVQIWIDVRLAASVVHLAQKGGFTSNKLAQVFRVMLQSIVEGTEGAKRFDTINEAISYLKSNGFYLSQLEDTKSRLSRDLRLEMRQQTLLAAREEIDNALGSLED